MSTMRIPQIVTTAKKAKAKAKPKLATASAMSRARLIITVALGIGIPAFTLAVSNISGKLFGMDSWACWILGTLLVGCTLTVLAVSLEHLAWAIADITRSGARPSWCLAIATDLTLVLCEFATVSGADSWVIVGVMVMVTITSMVLNCWAFLCHE